jgi:outer membrane protein insertion porin family
MYADQGYAYANVAPLTRVDDASKTVDLALEIEQGPQVSVERINITGNTKTRDKVIRREMKIVEGELYNATALKRSKARINNLGFFEAVDVTTSEGSSQSQVNVDVNVKERATGTFSVGAGYSSVDGLIAQGSVTQENFLGRGLRLNLAASLGGESTTYQIGLTNPYFLDLDLTLGFELYKTEREWNDFSRKATGGAHQARPAGVR